jgi:hypothetical protein
VPGKIGQASQGHANSLARQEPLPAGTQHPIAGLQASFGRARLKPRPFPEYNRMIKEFAENVRR